MPQSWRSTFEERIQVLTGDNVTYWKGDVALGRHIKKVTILQQDGNKDDVFQLTLEEVIISSYQLSGDEGHEVPTEQLSFNFTKITIKDMITGTTFGWNLALNKAI